MSETDGGITEGMSSPNNYSIQEDAADLDWESALKELEQLESRQLSARQFDRNGKLPAVPPAPKAPPPPAEEEADPEPVDIHSPRVIMDRYSDILSAINTGMNLLGKFEERHPYLIAPNIYRVLEDGLKESSLVMFREFHRLRERMRNETGEEL